MESTKTQILTNSTDWPYYISKQIKAQLDNSIFYVKNHDEDRVFIVDGREGSGKSTLAMQLAYYCDQTFNLNRIVYNTKDFEAVLRGTGKYKAIMYDEAFIGLSSTAAMSKENKRIQSLLQQCRQQNLFVFLVLPWIFLLSTYVALGRSEALFHVQKDKGLQNLRHYKVYNYQNKKKLYFNGKKKFWEYGWPRIEEYHRFYGKMPPTIQREEYIKKKSQAFKEQPSEEKTYYKLIGQRNIAIRKWREATNISGNEIVKIYNQHGFNLEKSQIYRILDDVPKTPVSPVPSLLLNS